MSVATVLTPASKSWKDRLLPIGVVIGCLILLSTLVFAAAAALGGWSASDNSGEVARQSTIGNCRTAKYGKVIDASTRLDLTSAELQVLLSTGLAASVDGNEGALVGIVRAVPPAAQAVTDAAAELNAATTVYVEATSLAATDPDAFLRQCQSGTTPTTETP